jgi:hypothetical protein
MLQSVAHFGFSFHGPALLLGAFAVSAMSTVYKIFTNNFL